MLSSGNSIYIASAEPLRGRSAKSLLSFLGALLAVFTILFVSTASNMAFADDGSDDYQKLADKYNAQTGDDGFGKTMDKYDQKDAEKVKETDSTYTFANVIQRVFGTRYLNYTRDASGGLFFKAKKWNCNADDPGAGTPLYHNCDVPNMTTQFLQSFIQGVSPMGFVGGTVTNARSDTELGVPSNLPGPNNTVPWNYAAQGAKYTGLEILGYNLHYTTYKGEWDYINVSTKARMLANYGLMDDIGLGVNAAINGTINGLKLGGSKAWNNLKQGNVIGAFAGFYTGFGEGAAAGAVRTILDSSDLNVFNTNAWYRPTYGGTIYNGRELTEAELSDRMHLALIMMIQGQNPSKAKVPDDYNAIKNGPPKPDGPISKCTDSKNKVIGDTSKSPGISQADCTKKHGTKWIKDGTRKQQTLKDWKSANSSAWDTAKKYNFTDCTFDDVSETNRQTKLDAFYACWALNWPKHQGDAAADQQSSDNQDWQKKLLSKANVSKWLSQHPEWNINTPWVRYVCLDSQGNTMYKSGSWDYEFVYDKNGNVNPKCKPLRAPVQNGYFGNGYFPEGGPDNPPNQIVQNDTRYSLVNQSSTLAFLLDPSALTNTIGNAFLSVTSLEAKIANTVIDFSFSPIVQKVGLDKTITDFIQQFRDGVYFPLLVIVMGFAALTILFNAGRSRDHVSGLKSALLTILTAFLGIMILFSPNLIIKIVDSGPAEIETSIAGTIFSVGNDPSDTICSASNSSPGSDSRWSKSFAPGDEVRTMECEVWRVFVFNPYVYGQWGVSSNALWASDSSAVNKMRNTNTNLVGDAAVPMGGGQVVHNWALYQAKVLSSGTITTDDTMQTVSAGNSFNKTGVSRSFTVTNVNTVPGDLYRVVDMQAGPNNGAGTDGRYFAAWSGQNPMSRVGTSFLSMITGAFGMVAVIIYGFAKIEITIFSLVMMMFLPFILLIGVHPTAGRVKLKQYIATIIGLIVQRIALVALLSTMLLIMSSLALASTNSLITTAITIAVCSFFIANRKKILTTITGDIHNAFGGSVLPSHQTGYQALKKSLPLSVQNSIDMRRANMRGMVSGAAAGYMVNGTGGIVKGARQGATNAEGKQMSRLRRLGQLGTITNMKTAAQLGAAAATKELLLESERLNGTQFYKDTYKAINDKNYKEVQKTRRARYGEDAEELKMPVAAIGIDMRNPEIAREMVELDRLSQRLAEINRERRTTKIAGMPAQRPARDDIAGIQQASRAIQRHNAIYDAQEKEVEDEINLQMDKLYKTISRTQTPDTPRYGTRAHRKAELEKMREELKEGAFVFVKQELPADVQRIKDERAARKAASEEEEYFGERVQEEGDQ